MRATAMVLFLYDPCVVYPQISSTDLNDLICKVEELTSQGGSSGEAPRVALLRPSRRQARRGSSRLLQDFQHDMEAFRREYPGEVMFVQAWGQ
jgi:hypothetical protein